MKRTVAERPILSAVCAAMAGLALLPGAAMAHGSPGGGSAGSAPSPVPEPPPEFLEAWRDLLTAREEIEAGIAAKRPAQIRAAARNIRPLALVLQRLTADLSRTKTTRARSGAIQLSKISEHLVEVADRGDERILLADLKRIDRALRMIAARYPEGSLPGASSHGH